MIKKKKKKNYIRKNGIYLSFFLIGQKKNYIYCEPYFPQRLLLFPPTLPSSCVVLTLSERSQTLWRFSLIWSPNMPSSGNSSYGFRFRVWQFRRCPLIKDLSHSHPHTPDEVPIEFRVTEWLKIKKSIGNGDRPVSIAQARSRMRSKTFWVPKQAALSCDGGARMLSLLSDVGAPGEHQEAVLRDISSAAAARSARTGTSPIVVTFEHTTLLLVELDGDESEDVMDMVLRESMVLRPIPAARSAIERLKKVTFEDGLGSIGECIICREEFEDGLELTRLPCSHVYHGDCIVKWLEKSHCCPLCRYPLPGVH
jgi:hypothetical protein